jgi:HPt (histidine-containing phosphotransfer) domain-containing protein
MFSHPESTPSREPHSAPLRNAIAIAVSLVALTGLVTRPSGQMAGVTAIPAARPADPRNRRPLTPSGNEPQPESETAAVVLDPRQVQSLQSIPGLNHGTLLGELAEMLRHAMPGRLAELARHAAARDSEVLASQAHALAGSCASIGGRQMQAAINAVENAAVAGDWGQMPARVALVTEAWNRLDQALSDHLRGSKP